MKRRGQFFVYIIEDKYGTYYTGYTRDIKARFDLHQKGKGAKRLKGRTPLKMVFVREFANYKCALNAERRIKNYPRQKKEELLRKAKAQAKKPS